MNHFAETLKNLRQNFNLTMQELADKAGISKSMISKIECGNVQPTIDVAGRLAKALGKNLSEMLHIPHTPQVMHLTRNEQAVWEDADRIKRRNISPVFEGLKTEWLQVELPANTSILKSLTMHATGTEKHILVTKGTLEVKLQTHSYKLKKGDSLYFDAIADHALINSTKETVEFFIVVKHADNI